MHDDVSGGEQLENAGPVIETDATHDPGCSGSKADRLQARRHRELPRLRGRAAAISVSTSATGRAYTLAIGNVTAIGTATTIGGHHLAGLMQTTAQLVPGQSAGGPLVNLSGQVIGIDLAGLAHGTSITSYAIPINEALAVARQLKP